jgi:putative glutamine amidotransferase
VRVYLAGREENYLNYRIGIEAAGGMIRFGGDPLECDALLLPGGGDLEPWRYGQQNLGSRSIDAKRDQRELDLMDLFIWQRKPVLGICRGLQVVNVYFGGSLIQNLEGHSAVNGADRYHSVQTTEPKMENLLGAKVIVNSAHHQAIDRLGKGLTVFQKAPDGIIEGIFHESLPVWAVQWHPERVGRKEGMLFLRFWMDLSKKG